MAKLTDQATTKLIGRDGIIGQRFIGGTDEDRRRYARFISRLNPRNPKERIEAAKSLQNTPTAFIAPEKGFALFEPGHFPGTDAVVATVREIMRETDPLKTASGMLNKPQLFTQILDRETLTLDSPFLRFALQSEILTAVSAYLGTVPILHDMDIWYSVSPSTDTFTTSQLWHCDWESLSQIRMFVYVSDVTPSHGPLAVLEAQTSRDLREHLGYTFFNHGSSDRFGRIPDEQIHQLIGDRSQHVLTGPAGSVAFVDTAQCLHYGSRVALQASRTVFACQFLPPTTFTRPLSPSKRAPFRHLSDPGLSNVQNLVLGHEC